LPFPGTSLRSAQIAQHVKKYVVKQLGLKASFSLSARAARSFSDFFFPRATMPPRPS
jgi:hypothetical protein